MSGTAKKKITHTDCQRFIDYSFAFRRSYRSQKEKFDVAMPAYACMWKEAEAIGKDPRLATHDPDLAAELNSRFERWFESWMDRQAFVAQKECPAAFDDTSTPALREAAELGVRLHQGDKSAEIRKRLNDFVSRNGELSQREWRMFTKMIHEHKPSVWKHPELDTFLILMWPVVERFNWTYSDVLDAIQKKFPGRYGDLFDLKAHCNKVLGLHTANERGTARQHPRGMAPLSEFVQQQIPTQADDLRRRGFLGK
jgi:hypothetical protein